MPGASAGRLPNTRTFRCRSKYTLPLRSRSRKISSASSTVGWSTYSSAPLFRISYLLLVRVRLTSTYVYGVAGRSRAGEVRVERVLVHERPAALEQPLALGLEAVAQSARYYPPDLAHVLLD